MVIKRNCLLIDKLLLLALLISFLLNFVVLKGASQDDIVVNHEEYVNPRLGSIFVVGEVINNRDSAIRDVKLTVTFFNSMSEIIKKYNSTVFLEVIPPGRRSAFKLSVPIEEVEGYKYCEVEVSSYITSDSKPPGFYITSARAILYENRTEIIGSIRSTVPDTLRYLNIFALLYTEDGFIGVTDSDLTIVKLDPYETTGFKCITWLINATTDVKKVIVTGESLDYGIKEEKVITSSKSNNSNFYIMVVFIAIVITLIAVATALVFTKRRRKKKVYKRYKHIKPYKK